MQGTGVAVTLATHDTASYTPHGTCPANIQRDVGGAGLDSLSILVRIASYAALPLSRSDLDWWFVGQ
jgi:hypothetical protein